MNPDLSKSPDRNSSAAKATDAWLICPKIIQSLLIRAYGGAEVKVWTNEKTPKP